MANGLVDIFSTIFPVVIMLIIGWVSRKYSIFTRAGIDAMKKFVVNIALSAVLINAFATMEYSIKSLLTALIMFGVCVFAWAIGVVFKRFYGDSGRFIPFLVTGFEAGMLGYALYSMLYGTEHISEFAKIDLGQVLFVFTMYKVLIGMDSKESVSGSKLIKDMITSPTIISIIVGVIIGASGIHSISAVGTVLDACTDFVAAPTSAVILLTIGYDLVFDKIPWGATIKTIVLRLAIMAVALVGLRFVFGIMGASSATYNALTVMLILPPPYVISVFADDEKQQTFLSSTLTVSTLVTIIGFIILTIINGVS